MFLACYPGSRTYDFTTHISASSVILMELPSLENEEVTTPKKQHNAL